jgi:hypothetical protein
MTGRVRDAKVTMFSSHSVFLVTASTVSVCYDYEPTYEVSFLHEMMLTFVYPRSFVLCLVVRLHELLNSNCEFHWFLYCIYTSYTFFVMIVINLLFYSIVLMYSYYKIT